MESTKVRTLRCLEELIGLKLSIARRAADMRVLHFGEIAVDDDERGSAGEIALHIQCPWRIEGPNGIVTGRDDIWEPADRSEDIEWETWDYEVDENLQDLRMGELLGGIDPTTGSFANTTNSLVVEAIETDDFGSAVISLSGGYRLVIFPSGSTGEDWRLFRPRSNSNHFVISGGAIE